MMLSKMVFAARRFARRSPASALHGLLSPEQLARVLARERARSDRTGEVFSLAVFAVGKRKAGGDTMAHLAKILQQRLRLTDDAGLLDPCRIGVVLPATPASGAWTVVDDVCLSIPAGLRLPECTVYCYPSEWPGRHLELVPASGTSIRAYEHANGYTNWRTEVGTELLRKRHRFPVAGPCPRPYICLYDSDPG